MHKKQNPQINIYCIGATLDIYNDEIKTDRFSRFGLEWLFHLFLNPKELIQKY